MERSAQVAGIALAWHDLVPGRLGLWAPARPDEALDALVEEALGRGDDRTPYFASLWPAGEALARHVLAGPRLEGRAVLDLGCGLGPAGLAALAAGARVTFLDWEPRALEIVAHSARRQGLEPAALVTADWQDPPPLGRFDLVLAADVLYERDNLEPVGAFLAAHLSGEAWLADPRRDEAEDLPRVASANGLVLHPPETLPYRPRGVRVNLWRIQPHGAGASR